MNGSKNINNNYFCNNKIHNIRINKLIKNKAKILKFKINITKILNKNNNS